VSLGGFAAAMGDFEVAAQYLKASKKTLGSLPSINYLGEVTASNELARASHAGMLYLATGDFRQAERTYQEAAIASRKIRGNEHLDVLNSLIGLADFYQAINSKQQAARYYREVLEVSKSMFSTGVASFDEARIQAALAAMNGDYANALEEMLKVKRQAEQIFDEDHEWRIRILINLAYLYKENDLFDETLKILNELETHPLLTGKDYAIHAVIELIRSQALLGLGEPEKAMVSAESALYGFYGQGALDINIWAAEAVLGQASMALGDVGSAIYFGKASVNRLSGLQTKLSSFDAQVRQDFLGDKHEVYRSLADALISAGDIASAQRTLGLLKQEEYWQFTRDQSGDAELLTSSDKEIEIAQPFHETTRNILEVNLELRELKRQRQSTEIEEKIHELETEKKQLRRGFSTVIRNIKNEFSTLGIARNVELGEKRLDTLGLLQRNLLSMGDGIAVVHYLVTRDKIHLIVTTRNGSFNRVQEISSTKLGQLIFEHRENLEDLGANPIPVAQELYEILLGPIEVELRKQSITKLMVSLDGLLRYIPFQSLHDGQRWLVDSYMIANYTPATDMTFQKSNRKNWRVNAFGVSEATSGFNALPSVIQELDEIVKVSGDDTGVLQGSITLNEDFTRSRFSTLLNQGDANVVHVASHFNFKPGRESESYLLIGDGEQITLEDFAYGDYPLFNIDLLTLSACNTGLSGVSADGSEIEGFGVLAQNQGAAAVLSSLWAVADESTSKFMVEFYRQRETHQVSKGEALRRAQLSFINDPEHDHPFFWAPFTLMGNWL
jgi:CHAT domain-containing protein